MGIAHRLADNAAMSDYQHYVVHGGTYFFTIVTYHRQRIVADANDVNLLRNAVSTVKQSLPFEINAAVILPDHMHFLWSLPPGDADSRSESVLSPSSCDWKMLNGSFYPTPRDSMPCIRHLVGRKRSSSPDEWSEDFESGLPKGWTGHMIQRDLQPIERMPCAYPQ